MTQIVTTRLPENIVEELENVSKEEYLDRASLLRKMIIAHLEEYSINKAAEGYQKGELSLEEAAAKAKVSIWKMLDHITLNNINQPSETLYEMEESLEKARELMK